MESRLQQRLTDPEEAKLWAQLIAFAPFVFQLARCLKEFKILKAINSSIKGLSFSELQQRIDLSEYSLSVLLDAGESSGILKTEDGKFFLSLVGRLLLKDKMTEVNLNFTHDVCYKGLFSLDRSLQKNAPTGLKEFGDWPNIYQGLSELPPQVLKSWLEFDHFYSDEVFPQALPIVFTNQPKSIMDIGGNTGKFAVACGEYHPEVQVTILDYPKQLELAEKNAREHGLEKRVHFRAFDLLDHERPFPQNHEVIWMSQFLDCFSKKDIAQLLKRAHAALPDKGQLFIMETFIDQQKHEIAKFCLDMISLYFTNMANGNSRMYRVTEFRTLLAEANFEIVEEFKNIGLSHTILKCQKKGRF